MGVSRQSLGVWLVAVLAAGFFAAGCSTVRRLAKNDPNAPLNLPARTEEVRRDSVREPQIITYRKQDGTELVFAPVVIDSLTGEKMMSVAIEEVVISVANRRNLVERNGRINIEFIVTVPEVLQDRSWQLVLDPLLSKGDDTLSLKKLVYTGERFLAMQQREYNRYGEYLDRIVDSADYFDRFGRKGAYGRYMDFVDGEYAEYGAAYERLGYNSSDWAAHDPKVGWLTPREKRRQQMLLRNYIRSTDRNVARRVTYTSDSANGLDHLNDYFAPRYRYAGVEVLPGGEVYTRIEGEYPVEGDRRREGYLEALADSAASVRRDVARAGQEQIRRMAFERMVYTGRRRGMVSGLLREMSDSAALANHRIRKAFAGDQAALYAAIDTASVQEGMLRERGVSRNERLAANRDAVYARVVRHPFPEDVRLNAVISRPDGKTEYHYTEQVEADENTSKLRLFLGGGVETVGDRTYRLQKSDTLVYNVSSMTTFIDEAPRYMQRIVLRDAEANARFFFVFPEGKSVLVDTLLANRRQIAAVRSLTRNLMTDPVYIIDSITLRASASPEGAWGLNDRLARERAEALRRVLTSEFRVLYDSLRIAASVTLDAKGRQVTIGASETLPDLPNLLRTSSLSEDWPGLRRMIVIDTLLADKEAVLALIDRVSDPDAREWQIRMKYPRAYERMRHEFYPQLRAVDFRFNLHRRGMLQDTVYTTQIDSNYMHGIELLKKRRYAQALEILRPYDDRNTALAYLSQGYDAAAYRILRADANSATTADIQYMLAILTARLGDEKQAVHYFLRSVELRENLKFRGNLDPEISHLIRKYELFRNDF